MHPKHLKIEDFTYDLPAEKIAYNPVNPRDQSKLLVYKDKKISENIYRNICDYLPENAVLVFNDTKVVKSRLFFKNENGANIEVFCLEPYGEAIDYEQHFLEQNSVTWICFIGKVSKWREQHLAKIINLDGTQVKLSAEIVGKLEDAYLVKFTWSPGEIPFGKVMDAAGATPLPPYIKRVAEKVDEDSYQTVYSENEGSVAAPTAGLHFTERVLNDFEEKGISSLFTTLHVGAGTFKPVKSEVMEDHIMHAEYLNITTDFLENLITKIQQPIITVGTTSTRTLESIYWMGNMIAKNPEISYEELKITQWLPYETEAVCTAEAAIKALVNWIKNTQQKHLSIETEIIIAPGYSFKIVKGLITNFHQPQSTLLLLVSALIGNDWKKIYKHALENDFRFLSYGDGSLLLPTK
ncbi:S-adenosylmethionine:tRNA ribosyltransferase-isomerase [Chryseobacterium sp. HSC-36S06]|uniref:S-adenosylmethionine:tRNA ribosyltransferase-isomerase n=1 Tax=Chryseobacterium sp. HSC-36S06 TaxID=2910970 RepID=UPI0020A08F2D|nr:S-adenosylmethionine:tRNA ribosyltransferase-isomerase [Chryseobacterium sp. HSC-36S06]MCP2037527.1 S-adenosylmethionine:tRNA ribosyltransferase-isomerase [Chryseobacterium sp. HSC-36S06]